MKGKILGERYEILEKVGGGGMSIVYKAKCKLLNRNVAVKILREEFLEDEEFIKKFRRESQAAASLSHPNIVNVYDVGEEEIDGKKIYYIVMELVSGRTLKEVIRSKKNLSIEESLDYSIQIAEALEHAHKNHIVHRDIKPHNIMITEDGRAKVMDFGIAMAATSSTVTNTSNVIGSVHYFSPEQARGGFTDERSDIYSLGIVMYEMLTGRLPFEGETPVTVALKHIQEEMKSVKEIDSEIPVSIDNIIKKATQKSPDDRYQNITEMLNDLIAVNKDYKHEVKADNKEYHDSPTQVIPIVKSDDIIAEDNFDSTAEILDEKELKKLKKDEKKYLKEQEKKRKKEEKSGGAKVYILAILLAFAVVAVGGLGFVKAKSWLVTGEIEVPNLVGKYEEDAREELEGLGLVLKIEESVTSTEYEKDKIVEQSVEAGNKVKKGYTIKVNISSGLEQVKVPELRKRHRDEVSRVLEDLGLKANIKYEFNDDIEKDYVISQSIDANSEVALGTTIDIMVSEGKKNEEISMPDLIGRQEAEARSIITSNKLVLTGYPDEQFSDKPIGEVIWQNINPGDKVMEGSIVSIAISKGPEIIEEPDPEPEPEENNNSGNNQVSVTKTIDFSSVEGDTVKIVITKNGEPDPVFTATESKDKGGIVVTLTGYSGDLFEIYINEYYVETVGL